MNLAVGKVNQGKEGGRFVIKLEFIFVNRGNEWQDSYKQTKQHSYMITQQQNYKITNSHNHYINDIITQKYPKVPIVP